MKHADLSTSTFCATLRALRDAIALSEPGEVRDQLIERRDRLLRERLRYRARNVVSKALLKELGLRGAEAA